MLGGFPGVGVNGWFLKSKESEVSYVLIIEKRISDKVRSSAIQL